MSTLRRSLLLSLSLMVMACHGLLDVNDPTRIGDTDIANANGANARRLQVTYEFSVDMIGVMQDVARFTDEWTQDFPASFNVTYDRDVMLDQRNGDALQTTGSDIHLGSLDQVFVQAAIALPAVRAYSPDAVRGDFLAHLYAIRGYILLQMAEDLCPGFPANDVVNNLAAYSGPLTTDSAFTLAGASLDSALKYVHDSTRFETLARVAKGRLLLDRGRYDSAAAVVASVPTTSVYLSEWNARVSMPQDFCSDCETFAIGNREGGNGLAFASAHDPRIPVNVLGVRRTNPSDTLYYTPVGQEVNDRATLASGTEARLIQAEAALHDGNPGWEAILDSLRVTVGLSPLVDPGTANGRVDLLYSERAFWLFMTGRRLGDLRRLIWNYGRSATSVFPTGNYPGGSGGQYGTATSIPFIQSDQQHFNPHMTSGCQSGA